MKAKRDPAWLMEVGTRLRRAKEALGLKSVHMAKSLGMSSQRFGNYENGTRPFDIEFAITLSKKFGITMDYLYWGDLRSLPTHLSERISQLTPPSDATRH